MKNLDDLRDLREELNRRLRAAHEAAVARGASIDVSAADRGRFEETCQPRPLHGVHAPKAQEWVRC